MKNKPVPFFSVSMDDDESLLMLVKFLDNIHTESFLSGSIKMGSAEKYRKDYAEQPGLRNDPDEFMHEVYGDEVKKVVIISEVVVGECEGVLRYDINMADICYAFCAVAINSHDLKNNHFSFDPRLGALGDRAIIIEDVVEFKRRIHKAISKNSSIRSYPGTGGNVFGLVRYIDFCSHQGYVGPFIKDNQYAYQKEFRVAIVDPSLCNGNSGSCDSYFLQVGDIRDIVTEVRADYLLKHGLDFVRNDSSSAS